MCRLLNGPTSNPNCGPVWVAFVLLGISAVNTQAKIVLSVPDQVSLSGNSSTRELTISWFGGEATTFDVIILRVEFNETVFYGTVSARVNQDSGQHQWTWRSVEPLECTSLAVKIRSRDGETISEWSKPQILEGRDLPSSSEGKMYPVDNIVAVGSNTTFCCIVREGSMLKQFNYSKEAMKWKRLSRRSYAITAVNQIKSNSSGTNVLCSTDNPSNLAGTVIFVGYPPKLSNFTCETRDLISAVCHWDIERDTNLQGIKRASNYFINKRKCPQKKCEFPQWDGNWTLEAVNPLGQHSLKDAAEISHRVRPVAAENLTATCHAWNVTVDWTWTHSGYSTLDLICQVELTSTNTTLRNFSGVGLHSVVLLDVHPHQNYTFRLRCGCQKNFWKWGDWSNRSFTTEPYVPDSPDVWIWMNEDNTGKVFWKPLTQLQRHGELTGYEVTVQNPEENEQRPEVLSPTSTSLEVNTTLWASFRRDKKIIATVVAKNIKGTSQPSNVPLKLIDHELPALSRAVNTSSGFALSWPHNGNSTCRYLVEWCEAGCTRDCPVEWIRLDAGATNVSIQPAHRLYNAEFQPGVRYNISLYGCPDDFPVLLRRWQGYYKEQTPSSPVSLKGVQQECDVVLSWEEIPLAARGGFLQGYNVYINKVSNLSLLANLSTGTKTYTVKGLPSSFYKSESEPELLHFTVKAYTAAGEDTGSTTSIRLDPCVDGLILEILASLGMVTLLLISVTYVCYKKRRWVKKAFYPDIPEPKLPVDWSRTQGPLDVKPSPHSMVHIIEKPGRDPCKDTLIAIPEEEDYAGEGVGNEPVDTDEPQSLRYYNQVVDERPIRPRFPDSSVSSSSSVDSASTDVTYTGIHTSCSSLVFPSDPQRSSDGSQPNTGPFESSRAKGGGYQPQLHPANQGEKLASPELVLDPAVVSSGGYKPQSSWLLDSPTEADEKMSPVPLLGSPTSVASTQFLLPDRTEEREARQQPPSAAAVTWFSNLLTSAKP